MHIDTYNDGICKMLYHFTGKIQSISNFLGKTINKEDVNRIKSLNFKKVFNRFKEMNLNNLHFNTEGEKVYSYKRLQKIKTALKNTTTLKKVSGFLGEDVLLKEEFIQIVDEKIETVFMQLIADGDLSELEKIIHSGFDINHKYEYFFYKNSSQYKHTPLVIATIENQKEIVQWLLKQNGVHNSSKNAALVYAVLNKKVDIVRLLLKQKGVSKKSKIEALEKVISSEIRGCLFNNCPSFSKKNSFSYSFCSVIDLLLEHDGSSLMSLEDLNKNVCLFFNHYKSEKLENWPKFFIRSNEKAELEKKAKEVGSNKILEWAKINWFLRRLNPADQEKFSPFKVDEKFFKFAQNAEIVFKDNKKMKFPKLLLCKYLSWFRIFWGRNFIEAKTKTNKVKPPFFSEGAMFFKSFLETDGCFDDTEKFFVEITKKLPLEFKKSLEKLDFKSSNFQQQIINFHEEWKEKAIFNDKDNEKIRSYINFLCLMNYFYCPEQETDKREWFEFLADSDNFLKEEDQLISPDLEFKFSDNKEGAFHAHKSVLCQAMKKKITSKSNTISVDSKFKDALCTLLEFLYRGKLPEKDLSLEELEEIVDLCHELEVEKDFRQFDNLYFAKFLSAILDGDEQEIEKLKQKLGKRKLLISELDLQSCNLIGEDSIDHLKNFLKKHANCSKNLKILVNEEHIILKELELLYDLKKKVCQPKKFFRGLI